MDIIIAGIILFVLVYFILWACYSMTPTGKKNFENSFKEVPLFHLTGLTDIPENALIQARISGGSLLLRNTDKSQKQIGINLNDIKDAKFVSEKEIVESDRSVITRALAGGLFFGVVGALVGGMSGLQKNKQEKITNLVNSGECIIFAPFLNGADIAETIVKRINGEQIDDDSKESAILYTLALISFFIVVLIMFFILS